MTPEELKKRIESANDEFIASDEDSNAAVSVEGEEEVIESKPVDILQQKRNEQYRASKLETPRGAAPKVAKNASGVLEGLGSIKSLSQSFRAAKHASERLTANGETARASMVRDQYMNEKFLPAIEALIGLNSIDELLNAKDVLKKLDELVLIQGGRADGYTAQYIRSLYGSELGQIQTHSDCYIRRSIGDMKVACARGNIRYAISLAKKMLDSVDNGEHSATEDDYQLISKVASRGM